ncbi:TIR domain-containing protein [Lentzea sp. BCCO 10_0061]|uniref:TIR domain-containing protein n=1 Tax=Lentzea sokolovensis TaxID=3095429 RepID=A0ABU4V3H1_9PSEU|nr:TIR domain-containing protein [Lentzea sp. BCCO 10_0061]MDX8145471.1 TIR domain-containing protein [Lentzea sp. BCCO 10_0061]
MSGGIFVSYRKNHKNGRRGHAPAVDAFVERLRTHFGRAKVYADTGLSAGEHYPSTIDGWLDKCEVLLVFVHQEWLADLVERKDELDWVRREIKAALDGRRHVVPVLLDKATMPSKDRLIAEGFDDIAQLGTRQYLPIAFGEWKYAGDELIGLLENRVATEELPTPLRLDPVRSRSAWPVVATALFGLVAPWLSVRLLVPEAELWQVWLVALALALVFPLVIPLGTVAFVYAARVRLDESDKHLAEMAHDQKVNITVGLFVAAMGIITLFVGDHVPWQGKLLVLAVIVGFTVIEGDWWLRDRRNNPLWPYVRLAPHPASVRGALAHVERFMKDHRPLLTRSQREQVEFVLDQVEWAVDRLHDLCALSRWAWLRRSVVWLPALHVLLVAAVIGSAVAALVEGGWGHAGLLVGAVVAAVLCHLFTVDRAYRLQRWRRQVVADAAPAEVARLRAVLVEISIPPAASQETTE